MKPLRITALGSRVVMLFVVVAVLTNSGGVGVADKRAGLTDTSASPHVVMCSVGLSDVRWTDGFWASRQAACREGSLPALREIMDGTRHSQFLQNFRIAAGLIAGKHRGPDWNDGDCYKWLEAVAAMYAVTHDDELARQMEAAVRVIAQAQRDDGYLHTPVLIRQRQGDASAVPFQNPLNFEMYNFGQLFTAACVHRRATGQDDLLKVAIKAADFLDRAFANPSPMLARNHVCPSHYMGMIELYRETRDERYLNLATKFLALRDLVQDGTDDNQDRLPFRKQTQAAGHAVRANYLFAGAADLYAETGDATLLPPLMSVWNSVVQRKMYVTGACGALYDGASPDGSASQKQIARVHQAYGRDYQLPNATAHNETCASVANVMWNWRMLQITGESRFADVLERSLYNASLAGISLDGKRFFYTNTLRQLNNSPTELRWSRTREPFISCFCCPPNVVRLIAEVGHYAYGHSGDDLWVNLYGSNQLDTETSAGSRWTVTQTSNYPWDETVRLTIQCGPAKPSVIRLRIPDWADNARLTINGEALAEQPRPGTFHAVRRQWQQGDQITLTLPMRTKLIQSHPLVEETRNQVAVQRGPLIYCLESPDLPEGVSVSDVVIPRDMKLTPRFDRELLAGITILEGDALAEPSSINSNELFQEVKPSAAKPVHVRLIPYFAWGNRGKTEMSVWLLGSR